MILFLLIIVFMLGRFVFIGYLCRMNAFVRHILQEKRVSYYETTHI